MEIKNTKQKNKRLTFCSRLGHPHLLLWTLPMCSAVVAYFLWPSTHQQSTGKVQKEEDELYRILVSKDKKYKAEEIYVLLPLVDCCLLFVTWMWLKRQHKIITIWCCCDKAIMNDCNAKYSCSYRISASVNQVPLCGGVSIIMFLFLIVFCRVVCALPRLIH